MQLKLQHEAQISHCIAEYLCWHYNESKGLDTKCSEEVMQLILCKEALPSWQVL